MFHHTCNIDTICALKLSYIFPHDLQPWRTMKAPLRHINCKNLTLESADKLANMSIRIQDTTYFAVLFQTIKGQILASISVILTRKDASIEPPCLQLIF